MSDAPYVNVTDGRIEYRASALGGCDMALLAARLGYESLPLKSNAKINVVFEAGHLIEEQVLSYSNVYWRQRKVQMFLSGRLVVVGHIDGIKGDRIVEVKSQNQEEWDRFGREGWDGGFFPKYKWQVSAYMHATNMPLLLVRALRDKNNEWTKEIDEMKVDEPFYSIAQIRERVLRVEAAAATGVLAAECTNSFPCPFFYLHSEIDRDLLDDSVLDILAREYVEAKADENVAVGKRKAARDALRKATAEDKYRTASGVNVTFYMAKDPPSLDKGQLIEFLSSHDRKLDEFQKQGQSERLRVTLPKERDDG